MPGACSSLRSNQSDVLCPGGPAAAHSMQHAARSLQDKARLSWLPLAFVCPAVLRQGLAVWRWLPLPAVPRLRAALHCHVECPFTLKCLLRKRAILTPSLPRNVFELLHLLSCLERNVNVFPVSLPLIDFVVCCRILKPLLSCLSCCLCVESC